ncbi:hypothetical protein GBAR_LOCUS19095 [Geodia barretti]|nr:hypothetical protein GBAR_LOCUS19095 [Geodia barretti]
MSLESSGSTKNDLFAPITRPSEPVSSFEGCDKLTNLEGSRYSVLRYDKTLSAVIDSQRYDYRESTETGDVMCFAVDLCHESESPVHMQISQPINDILVYQYLRGFTDRQWNILLNTVSVFKQSVTQSSSDTFWNGMEMMSLPDVKVDISVNTELELQFNEGGLNFMVEFSGDASFEYRERQGTLEGQITLVASSKIDGTEQSFHLNSYDRTTNAYFYIEGGGDPCKSKTGLSFEASYQPQPGELFFTRLLRFTEITQSCSFSAFLPITSDYRALGLSLHTECPLLAIGHLILPEMSHTITFIGSENPNCFTSNFLEVPDPALVIESELVNDRLPLGNIFELQANSTGPDVVTVFGREDSGPVSQFHSVQVTLFGGVFESEATVRNDQLTISTSSGSVFGYPAELTITAPSNKTDWQDLELTVDGSLLSGSGSFVESLSEVVTKKLRMLAESANSRREVAQMSLNQSEKRLLVVEVQYNEAVANVSLAEQRRDSQSELVKETTMKLQQVQREFNDSRDELQELVDIDKQCTEEVCRDVCMPGEVCRNCSMPTFIEKTGKCPITVKEVRNIRVPPFFVTRTTWMFVTQCRLDDNRVCIEEDCPVGVDKVCYGKCVPVFESRLPVYYWRMSNAPEGSSDAQGVGDEARELFQQLVEARRNRSLAQTSKRRAGVEYEIYKQRVDQLAMSLERLQKANDNSETVYDRTLEEVEPILRIFESGNDSGYQNVFSINGVTFNTKLTDSPTSLAFNLIDNSGAEYRESYLYISTQSEAVNLERMGDGIIDTAFIGDSKRSTWLQTRLRRQTSADLTPRQIFASRCTHISNTQLFFAEIHARLTEIEENINTSREGAGGLSESLSEDGPQEDEEFAAYLDLIRDYENLSMEALRVLESTIFSEWQAT